jgi:hypothetical protein
MRTHIRRSGIALLVAGLVTSLLSTTQAGVIPWLYDAIFGPAYPHYYGGYAPGWSAYGCAPKGCAPCNPCRVGYSPRSSNSCASGACSTTAFYGPCGATCSTTVACAGSAHTEVGKLAPEPEDVPPAAKTLDDAPVPDPAKLDLEHSKPSVSGVAAPDEATGAEDTGFGTGERGSDSTDVFSPPVVRPESGTTEESAPAAPEEAPPTLDLDNRTGWSVPVNKQRIGLRSSFRNARIARHAQQLDRDYVIPVSSTVHVAGN